MNELNEKQKAALTNYRAFSVNFPGYEVRTHKPYNGRRYFYIVPVECVEPFTSYIYSSDNLDHINGYLYGAVQAACGQLIKATPEQFNQAIKAL